MTDKLAVIILDALDDFNTKQLDMGYVDSLIREENSEVLGVSSLPYTAQSNPLIWGGYENKDKFWVKPGTDKWSFPAGAFNRDKGQAAENAERTWKREDFDTKFIWDDLVHRGVDASALHIPIVLPPYSFNPAEGFEMGDHWFPHSKEQIETHAEEMPKEILRHAEQGKSFIATSIQIPDKPLHAIGEGNANDSDAARICSEFDENMEDLIDGLENNGYDWVILGDHGSPWPGNVKIPETKQFVPNHRKNSVIVSNMSVELPTYTGDMFQFMRDVFDVESALPAQDEQERLVEEAVETLETNLNDDSLFLFTGGKEALVVSHMLQNRVDFEDVPYGVIDTGNHFEEMYEFRNEYAEKHGIDLIKHSYEELLENVILNDDDPRGFHGFWDDDVNLPSDLTGVAAQNASKQDWGVEESCGALKVNGVKKFVEDGFTTLITGQRGDDLTIGDSEEKVAERSEPLNHKRINPLVDWSSENVWRYIDKHNLDYPVLYDRGFNHTDAKCCTRKPNDIGEYGQQGVDVEKQQVTEQLKELGYI